MHLSNSYKASIRVASAQMELRQTVSFDALADRLDTFCRSASDYGADFICFPEHFTLQLLSGEERLLGSDESIARLTDYTDELKATLDDLAQKHGVNIVGGSHATQMNIGTRNVCFVALRDGGLAAQDKLHPTPDEREVWNIQGGSSLEIIETDCGPIGIQICYDSEFPELGREHVAQGVGLVFVPYCTDTRQGHLRVRYCCHGRTVENQSYYVTAGLTGTIANVNNLEMAYAQSAILTPSDFGFARDGIAAEVSENIEQMIIADLDMEALKRAREIGAVRNLADRRDDLYSASWKH